MQICQNIFTPSYKTHFFIASNLAELLSLFISGPQGPLSLSSTFQAWQNLGEQFTSISEKLSEGWMDGKRFCYKYKW